MDSFKKWVARRRSMARDCREHSATVLAALRSIHLKRSSVIVAGCVLSVSLLYWSAQSADDEGTELSEDAYATATSEPAKAPAPANSETAATLTGNLQTSTPEYFRKTYLSFMAAPLPQKIYNQGGIPKFVPQLEIDKDPFGKVGSYQPDGPTKTSENAFFEDLGENGRACVTCHQPPSGMSVSVRNIKQRLNATGGKDPIFAAVDGANCPDLVPESDTSGAIYGGLKGKGQKAFKEAHSLLINKGLIRIPLPVPANAEYTIKTVSDPTGCNFLGNNEKVFNKDPLTGARIISVFRRPVISTNLIFKTPVVCDPNTLDAANKNGNIMWDGREPTLCTQAVDATLGHAQAKVRPAPEKVAEIVAFEIGIFSAQFRDKLAKRLDKDGATGGPQILSASAAAQPPPPKYLLTQPHSHLSRSTSMIIGPR